MSHLPVLEYAIVRADRIHEPLRHELTGRRCRRGMVLLLEVGYIVHREVLPWPRMGRWVLLEGRRGGSREQAGQLVRINRGKMNMRFARRGNGTVGHRHGWRSRHEIELGNAGVWCRSGVARKGRILTDDGHQITTSVAGAGIANEV